MLKLDADLLPERVVAGTAVVENRARRRLDYVFDDLHGRGFSGSVRSQQTEAAAPLDLEGYIPDRDYLLVPLLQMLNFENNHGDNDNQQN